MGTSKPVKAVRFDFIDLLRGWAVIVMIETHVTNALLAPEYRTMWWFGGLDFFNGLVAPSFMFCAGAGLWIALGRKWEDYVNWRAPLWRYFRRLGWILGVAYALHLPSFSLRQMLTAFSDQDAAVLFQCDILHVIVVTLASTLLVALLTRRRWIVQIWAWFWIVVLVAIAPAAWAFARSGAVSLVIRNLLTESPGSYFPFVPWVAFCMAGIVVTKAFLESADRGRLMRRVFALGAALALVGLAFRLFYNPWSFDLWRATPIFFAMRIGCVLVAFSLLYRAAEWRAAQGSRSPAWVLLFGRESLLVYTVHLVIVYGSVFNFGIAYHLAMRWPPWVCLAIAIPLIAAMYLLARIWVWLKRDWPRTSAWLPYAEAAIFILYIGVHP